METRSRADCRSLRLPAAQQMLNRRDCRSLESLAPSEGMDVLGPLTQQRELEGIARFLDADVRITQFDPDETDASAKG